MQKIITAAIQQGASDIFLITGSVPIVRVAGELQALGSAKVSDKQLTQFFTPKLSPQQKKAYEEVQDVDFRMSADGHILRVNMHRQRKATAIALRIIPKDIPSPDEIGLSMVMESCIEQPHGLVLVTGPAGSGKSTTIAALLEKMNQTKKQHIITVEDPIEYEYENKESVVEQRQVGQDTPSYVSALKYILRQNPDVIMIGEMRDAESVAAVLTAAETGHLIFSTLHTPTAAETIERIIDLFPAERRDQVLGQVANVLRMVISQRLVKTTEGGLVAAREVLINTPAIANSIRNRKISQIVSSMQTSRKDGMITMKQSLDELVKKGIITSRDA